MPYPIVEGPNNGVRIAIRDKIYSVPEISALVLRAVEPGSTEYIRAAVDYDGIDEDDDALFNLTLQRVDPASGHIIDQETYRRASYREEDGAAYMQQAELVIAVDLGLGSGRATVWTCDLTKEYVAINGDYRT